MSNKHPEHIFKRFDREMRNLHSLVVKMGVLAVSQLQDAVATLEQHDVGQARKVIQNDQKLNALDVKADDEIVRIIALRQPMARDLREIIAVSKIIAELERAGDEARKIAGLTIRFYANGDKAPSEPILRDIYALSEYVEAMLTAAMRAFDDLDLPGALTVLKQGLTLDDQLQGIVRRLSTFVLEDSRNIGHFVDIVLGLRALERFGGHAKNIAGHIVFIKHGTDVRHEGVEGILRQIQGERGE